MSKMFITPVAAGLLAAAAVALTGCSGAVSTLFTPEFLGALGVGPQAALLPGDAPAIVVAVENSTNKFITATVSYRGSNGQTQSYVASAKAGDKTARTLVCSVSELTLGNIADLNQVGAVVVLGNGDPGDPTIEVEPFGVLLREGANYDCGDAITFSILNSGETRSGFQIFAFIQRAE